MVSKTLSRISWVWGIIFAVFSALLISLFPDETRNLITSTLGVSSEVFVLRASIGLAIIGLGSTMIILTIDYTERHRRVISLLAESGQQKTGYDTLMEVFSPIHAMIVRINKEIPREAALQLTVGAWINAPLIDSYNISTIFSKHNHVFRNKDLEMWLEIEKEIKEKKGFWFGRDRQKWFDELEAEYSRLTGALSKK